MQAAALGDDGVQTVRYWLYAPGEGACMWEEFYARGIMGLAWGEIGDLSAYAHKEDLKAQMLQTYPENGTQKNDIQRVSEALCMRFNPQSRRRVRNNDCCVPEEA